MLENNDIFDMWLLFGNCVWSALDYSLKSVDSKKKHQQIIEIFSSPADGVIGIDVKETEIVGLSIIDLRIVAVIGFDSAAYKRKNIMKHTFL